MAERLVFCPRENGTVLVEEIPVSFQWHPGFSSAQKTKSVIELHEAARGAGLSPLLEISTKSEMEVGRRLSAFNLKTQVGGVETFLECAFQGSKVFEAGGPYTDLLLTDSRSAKKDSRIKSSGKLIGFKFEGRDFPLTPATAFYDWLYIKTLFEHRNWLQRLADFAGFTDIEFNPEKSINCQARSLATFVALSRRNELESAMKSFDDFAERISASASNNRKYPRETAPNQENQGLVQAEIAVDLQRELCRAYVHFARRNEYKHYAFDSQKTLEKIGLHSLVNVEDEGLISALGRVRRLVELCKKEGLLNINIGKEIEMLDADIKAVRDMREHYDQYLLGRGQKQKQFMQSYLFKDGVAMAANAKWSLQRGAEEVLGARLSIDKLARALDSLRIELEDSKFWTLPHKANDLARLSITPFKGA